VSCWISASVRDACFSEDFKRKKNNHTSKQQNITIQQRDQNISTTKRVKNQIFQYKESQLTSLVEEEEDTEFNSSTAR
jgi:hypothetical protein